MHSEQQYIDIFSEEREQICANSAEVMNVPREAAYQTFLEVGLPTRKAEKYKYTDLQDVFAPNYGLNINRLAIPVNPYETFRCDVPNLSTSLYFVVNDTFHNRTRPKPQLPAGVLIGSLRRFAEEQPNLVGKYYNRLAAHKDGVSTLNTMFAQDGLFVYVPRNTKADKAIQVINILRSDVPMMVCRRVLIVLEEGAELTMLFCDHVADDLDFLTTQVVECFVGENAHLNMYSLEETHAKNRLVNNTYIDQQHNSKVCHNSLTLHNGLTRNLLELSFQGEGAECSCNGCAILDKRQHVDNNTLIMHHVGRCTSNELYKYVLTDEAVGAFAGRVLVEKAAQKTTSAMTNQNLCATKKARMYTQPQLEIYADDVKCSHGATIGQLNDAALFYMRQRGIPLDEARMLLQNAFIGEVINRIRLAPLQSRLRHLVELRFRGQLDKCEGCQLCK